MKCQFYLTKNSIPTPAAILLLTLIYQWFGAFLKRRNLVLRRVTTTGRDLPENMNSLIASFFAECMRARASIGYSLSKFGNISLQHHIEKRRFKK